MRDQADLKKALETLSKAVPQDAIPAAEQRVIAHFRALLKSRSRSRMCVYGVVPPRVSFLALSLASFSAPGGTFHILARNRVPSPVLTPLLPPQDSSCCPTVRTMYLWNSLSSCALKFSLQPEL